MNRPILDIQNLNKIYHSKNGDFTALKNINLKIYQGEFFGLLGPNGAGKSSLINILASLANLTSGSVNICGYDLITQNNMAKKQIGIVPQEISFDPFFNIYDAIDNMAGYYGIPKKQRKTDNIIAALGLDNKKYAMPRELSGGMKRRLMVAKALSHSPKILILDEPTAGVDIDLRHQLWEYIKILNQNGTTIIMTTHYLEEAQELCNRIAVINNGQIIGCDDKNNLLKNHSTKTISIKLPDDLSLEKITTLATAGLLKQEDNYYLNTQNLNFEIIIDLLRQNNIHISDIKTSEPKLEEVFHKMINANF
jgi:ABC-2 type transport system ATP-binding protein